MKENDMETGPASVPDPSPSAIADAVRDLVDELGRIAGLGEGQLLVIGCSSSEIAGARIGKASSPEIGRAVVEGALAALRPRGIHLAAQCCEHLNRALVVERAALPVAEIVNAVPVPQAGGSFATAAWAAFEDPVLVEEVRADAGLDIGDTFIGMHLKRVAIPVRLGARELGGAHVTAARTRPRYIGGERALHDPQLARPAASERSRADQREADPGAGWAERR